jgi:hypothetical protein
MSHHVKFVTLGMKQCAKCVRPHVLYLLTKTQQYFIKYGKGKGKVHPRIGHEGPEGGTEI